MTRGELDVQHVNLQRLADDCRSERETLRTAIERLRQQIAALDARLTHLEEHRNEDRS